MTTYGDDTTKVTGKIVSINRRLNSINGNPGYAITLDLGTDTHKKYLTGSDISDAYKVGNIGVRVGDVVTMTLTRVGRIRFIARTNKAPAS